MSSSKLELILVLFVVIINFVACDLQSYRFNGQIASSSVNNERFAAATGSLTPLDPIEALGEALPGTPGQDYPILAEVPETAFSCDQRVEGGLYADTQTECQVFNVCVLNDDNGLDKYSFLCPNGTIFNQEYFVCDWWFNFDCANAEGLYFRNDEIAAEREAIDAKARDSSDLSPSASGTFNTPAVAPRANTPQSRYKSRF